MMNRLIGAINKRYEEKDVFTLEDAELALFYHYMSKLFTVGDFEGRRDNCLNGIIQDLSNTGDAGARLQQAPFLFNCAANIAASLYRDAGGAHPFPARFYEWNSQCMPPLVWQTQGGQAGYLKGCAGVLHYLLALPEHLGFRQRLRDFDPALLGNQLLDLTTGAGGAPEQTDMSLSNGICGMLLVLTDLAQATGSRSLTAFIDDSIHQLIGLRQQVDQSEDKCSFFPYSINNRLREVYYDNRLCWESSDLAYALLFFKAGRLCRNNNYIRMAEIVALNTLLRKGETHTCIDNASIRYGAAGVAAFYERLYDCLPHNALLKGYYFWLEKTVAFTAEDMEQQRFERKETDILNGLPGIALTLAAHREERVLHWKRVLLL